MNDPDEAGRTSEDLGQRIARLEEKVDGLKEHMAVKNDVTGLKVWILSGALGSIAIAVAIAATVVKIFF